MTKCGFISNIFVNIVNETARSADEGFMSETAIDDIKQFKYKNVIN